MSNILKENFGINSTELFNDTEPPITKTSIHTLETIIKEFRVEIKNEELSTVEEFRDKFKNYLEEGGARESFTFFYCRFPKLFLTFGH